MKYDSRQRYKLFHRKLQEYPVRRFHFHCFFLGPPDDEGASSASKFVVSNQGGTKKNRNTKKNKINETKVKSGSGSQGNAASLNGAKGRGVSKTHKSRSSQKKGIPSNCQQIGRASCRERV